MFWPSKLFQAKLVIPEENKESLILALHETGVCQLEQSEEKICFKEKNSEEEIKKVRNLELRLNELTTKLSPYRKPTQPENLVKKLFFPEEPEKITVELRKNQEITKDVEKRLSTLEQPLNKTLQKLHEKRDRKNEIKEEIQELKKLPDVPTKLFESTENISVITAAVMSSSITELKETFKEQPVLLFTSKLTKEKKFIAVLFPPEKEKMITQALHKQGVEIFELPFKNKKPSEQIKELKEETRNINIQTKELKDELREKCAEHYRSLELLEEEIHVCRERIEAIQKLGGGNEFSVLTAWIPDSKTKEFKKIIEENTEVHYLELEEKEDAPTILKNPRMVRPFELLTELYSVPKYGRLDPTPIMALTYAMFFGFMLTDALYGFILMFIAIGVARGMGKYNPGIKRFAEFLVIAGAFTAIFGVLLGSYGGDLLQKMGFEIPQLLDPMKDILILVGITAGVGVLHLALGLVLGVIDNVKQKDYLAAISGQGVWLLFVLGLITSSLSMLMPALLMPGIGMIILSALLRMAFVFKKDGLVSSVLSVFDFSGFIGDIFSYTRLMALAVGTAGIALAINFMALMMVDLIPVVGIIIGLVILIIGHTFNMGMNGLGSFVHGLRLHFLEFFTKFYDGGGRLYKPFYATRKITKIKR